jgi:hypothetical protein
MRYVSSIVSLLRYNISYRIRQTVRSTSIHTRTDVHTHTQINKVVRRYTHPGPTWTHTAECCYRYRGRIHTLHTPTLAQRGHIHKHGHTCTDTGIGGAHTRTDTPKHTYPDPTWTHAQWSGVTGRGCTHMCVHTQLQVGSAHAYTRMYTHTPTYSHSHTHARNCSQTCIRMHTHKHTNARIHVCTHACTHTHKHAYKPAQKKHKHMHACTLTHDTSLKM